MSYLNQISWDCTFEIGLSIFQLLESYLLYKEKILFEKEINNLEIKYDSESHNRTIFNETQTHLLNILNELERHFQQLTADLISTCREAERDMFDQKSQQFQTLALACTIMLTSLITVLIQGNIKPSLMNNRNAGQVIFLIYSFANALSLALLVISIVLSTEILSKASTFMYKRTAKYNRELKKAVDSTRLLMKSIRSKMSNNNNIHGIASMNTDNIKSIWESHEDLINKFMQDREAIHFELAKVLLGQPDKYLFADNISQRSNFTTNNNNDINHSHDFLTYWKRHCTSRSNVAIICFYIGTLMMTMATVIYMWTNFILNYNANAAAYTAVVVLGFSGTFAMTLVIYIRRKENEELLTDNFDSISNATPYNNRSRNGSTYSGNSKKYQNKTKLPNIIEETDEDIETGRSSIINNVNHTAINIPSQDNNHRRRFQLRNSYNHSGLFSNSQDRSNNAKEISLHDKESQAIINANRQFMKKHYP